MRDNCLQVFFALIKAGLWEQNIQLLPYGNVDFNIIYKWAIEQSVVGIVAAGLEHVTDTKIPQQLALQFAGQTMQLEQRNKAMNVFVAEIIEQLRNYDIYSLLVKGQGIAQCYNRPLWRACGDVDLLLSEINYNKALVALGKDAYSYGIKSVKNTERKHQEYQIGNWIVELHGTLHSNLSWRIDKEIDRVQCEVFCGGNVRSWMNGRTQIFIPRQDEDVIFVFSHILQHLFLEGVGLRQICDWCRLLYTYRDSINHELLKSRIQRMGLMTEWNVFGTLSVLYLGMPIESLPFLNHKENLNTNKKKAGKLMNFIMEVGNFGHNRKTENYANMATIKRKIIIAWKQLKDTIRLATVFPLDAPKFYLHFLAEGFLNMMRKA